MNPVRLAILALIAQSALITQPQPASIAGAVVNAVTGKPIVRATIKLVPPSDTPTAAAALTAITSDDGKFLLQLPEQGNSYKLSVQANGYVSSACGAEVLALAPGQSRSVRCELIATGTITGRVADRNGVPISNALVTALQPGYTQGRKGYKVKASGITNDLGEYRLFGLEPGRYYIREDSSPNGGIIAISSAGSIIVRTRLATSLAVVRRLASDGTSRDEAIAPLYYPDMGDVRQALTIDVRSGAGVAVDFKSVPIAVHRIRGRITGVSTVVNPPISVRLVPRAEFNVIETLEIPSDPGAAIAVKPDNSFELSGVTSGSYNLLATSNPWAGKVFIEVGDADVENVVLPVSPTVTVICQMVVDGMAADRGSIQITGRVWLHTDSFGELDRPLGINNTPGTSATFANIPAGTYQVIGTGLTFTYSGSPPPQHAYVKSIRAGSQDVLQNGLSVDGSLDTPVAIVLGTDFGKISGRVIGASRQPVAGATVALVPNLRGQTSRYKSVTTDASGRFQIDEVAPGGYRAFAWERVESGAWENAEFLAAVDRQGYVVDLRGDESSSVELTVISEPGQ